jgi:predicted N-acetyltransferase YhbS
MCDISLRPMAPEDAARVAALIRTAFATQSAITDPLPSALRVSEADVEAHLRMGGGVVAQVAETLVGSALWAVQDGGLQLGRLAVAPSWRRRGLGRALVAAAEAAARSAGLPVIRLSTRLVLLDNRRLFAACGFVETTRDAHAGYAEPTFVNMEKRLSWAPGPR